MQRKNRITTGPERVSCLKTGNKTHLVSIILLIQNWLTVGKCRKNPLIVAGCVRKEMEMSKAEVERAGDRHH